FQESQRLYPSVPVIGRTLTEDLVVGNFHLPAGSDVFVFVTALHRDPQYFPDPLRYDPTRFLTEEDDGQRESQQTARHPFAYVPFSAGQRNCIGQRFAMLEEKMLLTSVLRRFTCESLEPFDKVPVTAELVSRPLNGLPMKFTLRP
ncbi:cytochrome P450 4V2-like, partial [Tropilaelaps mercedesae]